MALVFKGEMEESVEGGMKKLVQNIPPFPIPPNSIPPSYATTPSNSAKEISKCEAS